MLCIYYVELKQVNSVWSDQFTDEVFPVCLHQLGVGMNVVSRDFTCSKPVSIEAYLWSLQFFELQFCPS